MAKLILVKHTSQPLRKISLDPLPQIDQSTVVTCAGVATLDRPFTRNFDGTKVKNGLGSDIGWEDDDTRGRLPSGTAARSGLPSAGATNAAPTPIKGMGAMDTRIVGAESLDPGMLDVGGWSGPVAAAEAEAISVLTTHSKGVARKREDDKGLGRGDVPVGAGSAMAVAGASVEAGDILSDCDSLPPRQEARPALAAGTTISTENYGVGNLSAAGVMSSMVSKDSGRDHADGAPSSGPENWGEATT